MPRTIKSVRKPVNYQRAMIRGNSYVFALLRAFGADFFSQVLGQVLSKIAPFWA
ncbi:hypothetical protein GS527_15995 [Leptospira borgpetersenii]|uniref:Uncharacterized protein n=1 Tax=Leptospira borgpetersenii str. 200701203 TaxID=1193007 RepID=M3GZQ3_LEPBO|nr:hypothetical protein LEP1GSC101_2425 [Leptospira borgpetersenii str. UI 09149]EKQ99893.1 hypothetical protein LEP1GSC121_1716 [Leptospira borgpetersenii serovar Castellonis str. 200801910]EMG00329.1 hypothetical protein LEP1GSC123_2223 [Leptospira borgpetersenii str. 200701203]EMN57098.1 hypothetical protein LEP1GSC090_4122 [Leptospira borgpetersenii serovar Javanica str. MK146]QHE28242.1 hypothetical protein GS524_15695 [Leptospira borgpetersenii]